MKTYAQNKTRNTVKSSADKRAGSYSKKNSQTSSSDQSYTARNKSQSSSKSSVGKKVSSYSKKDSQASQSSSKSSVGKKVSSYSKKDSQTSSSDQPYKSKSSSNPEKTLRINHFIAKYTSYSRRQADQLIKDNKIRINNHKVQSLSTMVEVQKDQVKVSNKMVRPFGQSIYIAFHKPEKTLTTTDDPKKRMTIFHYFRKLKMRVFAVGRLDWNTEGLILLTNDGEFSNRVTKPQFKIPKTYVAQLGDKIKESQIQKLKRGVSIPKGGRVKALSIYSRSGTWVKVVITEGKNKQLHHMFQKVGLSIKRLKRIAIGGLALGSLKKGEAKYLTDKEIEKIFNLPKRLF